MGAVQSLQPTLASPLGGWSLSYLVEVGQRVLVSGEPVVQHSQVVAGSHPPESLEVDHVQRRDVVGLALQVVPPEALLPEPVALHLQRTSRGA